MEDGGFRIPCYSGHTYRKVTPKGAANPREKFLGKHILQKHLLFHILRLFWGVFSVFL